MTDVHVYSDCPRCCAISREAVSSSTMMQTLAPNTMKLHPISAQKSLAVLRGNLFSVPRPRAGDEKPVTGSVGCIGRAVASLGLIRYSSSGTDPLLRLRIPDAK